MFGGLKPSVVREISSISKKLKINKSKLPLLLKAQKEGRPEEEVIAEVLDIPEGKDAKTYLHETLTDKEYQALRGIIETYTRGAGKNPLD